MRLLSKGEKTAGKKAKAELVMREWASMKPGCGCEGRYTPTSSVAEPEESEAVKAAKAWGDIPQAPVTYESWLRERVSALAETEINVQLGELTLKRHHMQLLEQSIARHEDFVATFGGGGGAIRTNALVAAPLRACIPFGCPCTPLGIALRECSTAPSTHVAVQAATTRYQCAEVKRSQNRRWMRLLGLRHDVQIWNPDDRTPTPPRAALNSAARAE